MPFLLHVPCSAGPDEGEPNNDANQAIGPLCPGAYFVGLPRDRYDVFFFEAAAGPITINLTNHAGSGVQLQLHHQTITLEPIEKDYDGADGYRIHLPNAPAGRYYIVISTLSPDPGATRPYELAATFTMRR